MSQTNNPQTGPDSGRFAENNAVYFLYKHSQDFPQRQAFKWVPQETLVDWNEKAPLPHKQITYGQLAKETAELAAGLKQLGIEKGDRVMIFLPMAPDMYKAMFAVQRLGAIAVFLDSWAQRSQIGACAKTVEPIAMISFPAAFSFCKGIPELENIQIKITAADFSKISTTENPVDIAPVYGDDTALITFTAGSSSAPKGANRTHQLLAAQRKVFNKYLIYQPDDLDLAVPLMFSLNNLANGITTILPAINLAQPSQQDALVLVNQLLNCKPACCTLPAPLFVNVGDYCRKTKIKLPDLRRIAVDKAPVSKKDAESMAQAAPNAEILVFYGPAETEPISLITGKEISADSEDIQGACVGQVCPELEYKIIKIHKGNITLGKNGWKDWDATAGQPGEVIVSGSHVCRDYYNDAEATNAAKIIEAGKIWHRTGDVGFTDKTNRLWLAGRVHNAIIRLGQSIFPAQAEILLKSLPFVQQAAFLGLADMVMGESTCAVIVLKPGWAKNDTQNYIDAVHDVFRKTDIPVDAVKFTSQIAMDPSHNKVEYKK